MVRRGDRGLKHALSILMMIGAATYALAQGDPATGLVVIRSPNVIGCVLPLALVPKDQCREIPVGTAATVRRREREAICIEQDGASPPCLWVPLKLLPEYQP